MFLYKAEQVEEALAKAVLENRSISYATAVQEAIGDAHLDMGMIIPKLEGLTKASIDVNDLYPTKSILVSTNWNLNDDVFSKAEVWPARSTASHKPTNTEHDPTQIVGHITNCWPIDAKGNTIADDTAMDDIPDLFHIVNGAVIYTHWPQEDLQDRADNLIASIKKGEMCVSMECHFSNFDYGIITPEKEYYIVARAEDTAHLTKHLRAYRGTGSFDGCKVGRVLKNITFSGKGYVENPANPYSKIFNDEPTFLFSKASVKNPFKTTGGVSIITDLTSHNMENNSMNEVEELKRTIATLQAQIEENKNAQSKKQLDELQTQIAGLQAQVEELTKAKADADSALAAAQEEAKAAKEDAEKSKKDKEEADKAKAEVEAQLGEVKAREAKATRVSTLVAGGYTAEEAAAKVEAYASLTDELFNVLATDLVAAKKIAAASTTTTVVEGEQNPADDTAAAGASTQVLENAQPTEAGVVKTDPAAIANEAQASRETARKALSNAFAGFLGVESEEDAQE